MLRVNVSDCCSIFSDLVINLLLGLLLVVDEDDGGDDDQHDDRPNHSNHCQGS